MFRDLVAAKLNILVYPDCEAIIGDVIAEADAWMESVMDYPLKLRASSDAWQEGGEDLKDTLDAFNNDLLNDL